MNQAAVSIDLHLGGKQNMDKAHLQLRRMALQPWFGDGKRQNYLEAMLHAGEMKSEKETLRGEKLFWTIRRLKEKYFDD